MSDDAFDLMDQDLNTSPEDNFYMYLTSEKMPKLYNCEYWLRHQLAVYEHLNEKRLLLTHYDKNLRPEVSRVELLKHLLEYYFMMYFLPRFVRTDDRPSCDMGKFLELVMSDPTIKKYLHPKPTT